MKNFLLIVCVMIVSCMDSYAQSVNYEWRQMNGAFTAFAQKPGSTETIFAGDMAGMIRRSDDRGATWTVVSMQSDAQINSIQFLDGNTGFAATGWPGLILMTSDGGNTWIRKQFADKENTWNQYRFAAVQRIIPVDDKTAFFDIFNHPISAPSAKETIITRDAGKSFELDTAPGEIYHVGNGKLIAFGRESDMFGLAKFTIYKSSDMGMRWDTVKISPTGLPGTFNFNGISLAFFLSENEFFLTANRDIGNDDNIYKTTDGGLTFTMLENYPNSDPGYIYFKNSSEGFVINDGYNGKTTYYTTDGGASWTTVEKGVEGPGYYLGNDTFIANRNDHTAISTDFGKSWSDQSDSFKWTGFGGAPSVYFMQLIDKKSAAASLGKNQSGVTSGTELMITKDGGMTWRNIKDASGNIFKGQAFHFVSPDTFFFIGSGYNDQNQGGYMKIKYTTDGGLTSKDVFTGGYNEGVKEIIFIDKNNALTYANNSRSINYSSDGGQTWTNVSQLAPLGENGTLVAPSVNAWYISNDKIVYKSTDQGKTWNDVSGNTGCGNIYFINDNVGFRYGCNYNIFKTTDGGQNWSNLSNGLDTKIKYNNNTMMAFQNESTGYMATSYANGIYVISKTTDGGNTWNWYNGSQVNSRYMGKIIFNDPETGVMMDSFGNFALYTGPSNFTTDTIPLAMGQVTGVEEFSSKEIFSVYPNPANEFFTIKSDNMNMRSIEISDVLGKILFSAEFSSEEKISRVNTKDLSAGMYILRIHTERGIFSQRLSIIR